MENKCINNFAMKQYSTETVSVGVFNLYKIIIIIFFLLWCDMTGGFHKIHVVNGLEMWKHKQDLG